jgi:hypothetical protein
VQIGQTIPDEISLLGAVTEILNGSSTHELQCIFRNWIERIENAIIAQGDIHPSKHPACHYLM